jgi:hypothetical protein
MMLTVDIQLNRHIIGINAMPLCLLKVPTSNFNVVGALKETSRERRGEPITLNSIAMQANEFML